MSRINSNVQSLVAQRTLAQNNNNLSKTLERLATGSRINRGGDDPAGLVAGSKLTAERLSIESALANAERAEQVVNIAEGGLGEINSLLLELQNLVGQTASDAAFSQEEREANQVQIDSILATIDRISSVTSFQGTKLLNGKFDFSLSAVNANVADLQVNGAKVADNSSVIVTSIVTQSAQHGGLLLSVGANISLGSISATFSFEVAGGDGAQFFSFASGTTAAAIATAITNFKEVTGVSATVSTNSLVLKSTEYGTDEFVSIKVSDEGGIGAAAGLGIYSLSSIDEDVANTTRTATFTAAAATSVRDDGQDVEAVVNGIKANTKGRNVSVNTDNLAVEFTLSGTLFNTTGATNVFQITGGGAKFVLGTEVNLGTTVALGIPNVAARNLGNNTQGFLTSLRAGANNNVVDGDTNQAQKVISAALDQVTSLRGRLGSFQGRTLGSTINALGVALENTSAAESVVNDTDFAKETADLTRNQVLVQAATSALSIANANPRNVLALLGG